MSAPENRVEVDQDALVREAELVEIPADSSPQSGEEGGAGAPTTSDAPAQMPAPVSWAPVSPGIVSLVDLFVCPNWKLSPAEQAALADALTPALDQLFPGGLGDERWAPYVRLLVVAGGIAASRYDRKTGKLAPLRAPPRSSSSTAAADLDQDAPPAPPPPPVPGGESAGSFTLGAGS